MESSQNVVWPFLLYLAGVIVLVGVMVGLSALLGPRHQEAGAGEVYESGVASTGPSHVRFAAKFYLMAMFFVIFDMEAVFLYAYAVSFRQLDWAAYVEAVVFTAILIAALVYLWRCGALDWGPEKKHKERSGGKII